MKRLPSTDEGSWNPYLADGCPSGHGLSGSLQLAVSGFVSLICFFIGGLIFGVGWGLLGYCPGTSAGALAEGCWDAVWGILGMLAGAALFAEAYPLLKTTVLTWGVFGKITLPQAL